jgi:uncharacterized membrane protein
MTGIDWRSTGPGPELLMPALAAVYLVVLVVVVFINLP